MATDPADRALLAKVGRGCRAAALAATELLPRAGLNYLSRFKLSEFCGSVARMARAERNGCPCHEGLTGVLFSSTKLFCP